MATADVPLAPYDDGSSTESEYYYDPTEESAVAVADTWEHENQAQETPHSQESTVIKLEPIDNDPVQQATKNIAPPEGSEWSHGAVATVYTNAVEQALAMARDFADTQQEPSTDDTINSNTSPHPPKFRELEEGEEVESNVISLKSVKNPTPPAPITKKVATGLRNPPREVVVPVEMEGELAVARPQWKPGQKSPRESKKTQPKTVTPLQREKSSSRHESTSSRRTEHNTSCRGRSSSIHPRKRSRSPSTRRRTRSRSSDRCHRSRSPARHRSSPPRPRVEYDNRRGRYSPPRDYSKRSRRRSPPRGRSRSPSRRRSFSSARYVSDRNEGRAPSPRQHYDSERRGYRRSRSPSPPRAFHDRFRSRSRSPEQSRDCFRSKSRSREQSRGHYDHHPDFGYDHNESYERNVRCPSPRRSEPRQTQCQTREGYSWYTKEDHFSAQQRWGREERSGGPSVQRKTSSSLSRPRLQKPVPHPPTLHSVAIPTANLSDIKTLTKSPRDPRVKPQVNEVSHGQDHSKNKPEFVHYTPFKRRVFKLKLQEADVDEAAARGFWTVQDKSFYERRRQNIAEDRAKLMMENLELFEQVYNSTFVASADLQRYQADRSFAKRVSKFKRKQESLQEQNNLFLSTEKQDELWRQLTRERESLIAENSVMYHKVMKDSVEPLAQCNGRAPSSSNAHHNGKPSHSGSGGNIYDSQPHNRRTMQMHRRRESAAYSISTRVVAGAALKLSSTNGRDDFKIPPAIAGNATWY